MKDGRVYSTRRTLITEYLVSLLKTIDGTGNFISDLNNQVYNKLRFVSDINDFPAVSVIAGSETRDYQTAGYKDRYLSFKIVVFANEENPLTTLDGILEDIETLLEDNGQLPYIDRRGVEQRVHDITILSISTDEGALEPLAIGEMSILVHY